MPLFSYLLPWLLAPGNCWYTFCHCRLDRSFLGFHLKGVVPHVLFLSGLFLLSMFLRFSPVDPYISNSFLFISKYVSIQLLMDIWVVSNVWLLLIKLLWTFMYNFFYWDIVDLKYCIGNRCTGKCVIHIYIYYFSQFFSSIIYYKILNITPCAIQWRLAVYFVYGSISMLILYSQFIYISPSSLVTIVWFLCLWVYFCFINKFICLFFRFHI